MNPIEEFKEEVRNNIDGLSRDGDLHESSRKWMEDSARYKYTYNFTWLGRPIIQYPQDIMAMQEIIWNVKPDLILETGIAHGGSLIFYASMLELIGGDGVVLGVDIDIRAHNRIEIEKHPMFKRISMIEGSSVDENVTRQVRGFAKEKKRPAKRLPASKPCGSTDFLTFQTSRSNTSANFLCSPGRLP